MAILIDKKTTVIVQGMSGKQGSLHSSFMIDYGVNVVAGVVPGKGGSVMNSIPVYDRPADVVVERGNVGASMIMVPAPAVLEAGMAAIEACIPMLVIITEHVPVHDTLKLKWKAAEYGVTIVGPNTIGIISPGKSKIGVMPVELYCEGNIGLVSRSGTMTHEIASALTRNHLGQSTCVGIGGDSISGLDFVDVLRMFRADKETRIVVLIGEIGGASEEKAAAYIKESSYPKPVFAFIGGKTAPAGRKMGHAGALISEKMGTAESKINALTEAGVYVEETVRDLVSSMKKNFL